MATVEKTVNAAAYIEISTGTNMVISNSGTAPVYIVFAAALPDASVIGHYLTKDMNPIKVATSVPAGKAYAKIVDSGRVDQIVVVSE